MFADSLSYIPLSLVYIKRNPKELLHEEVLFANERINAAVPKLQGAQFVDRSTRFVNVPIAGVDIETTSPTLCVKPSPGEPRSCTGANMVPRYNIRPSGY
jgi:hypothetical protein